MKVIDLLNKIANGEDTPNVIKFDNKIFTHNGLSNDNYFCEETHELLEDAFLLGQLNNEVEIIEDTPKEDKKIQPIREPAWAIDNSILKSKINEIIYKINKGE